MRLLSIFSIAVAVGAPILNATDTVRVFLLAGQSNMEGKADNKFIEHQATDEKTKAHLEHLRNDAEWVVRDDAFIKILNRNGALTIGYGSSYRNMMKEIEATFEEWKLVSSDRPYHDLGSAICYTRIGHGMGESMLELLEKK
jgi:hypothetical protein